MQIGKMAFVDPKIEQIFKLIPAAVAVFDRDMKYVAASDRWISDYQLESRHIIGKSHYDIFPELPGRWKALHERCLSGESIKMDLDSFERPDGKIEWLQWELVPCRNHHGEVAGLILYTDVLTEAINKEREISEVFLSAIGAISKTIEKRDPYTAGHEIRVASLSVAIARELGWSEDRIEGVRLGATIHDIGKISVPAEILNRPGKLTEHEFGIIKAHPDIGQEIVSDVKFPWPVREMIQQHHERLDGSGYPKGLKGDEIIEEARVIAVADVVEAITAHRPYRAALGLEAGLREIERGRDTIYDPKVVNACLKIIRQDGFNWDKNEAFPLLSSEKPANIEKNGSSNLHRAGLTTDQLQALVIAEP